MDYEFAAVFVDEAQSMPSQTREIIDGLRRINPNLRVIGLTATRYAMGKGYVFARDSYRNLPELREVYTCNPYFAERVFDKCVYELIAEGFLSHVFRPESRTCTPGIVLSACEKGGAGRLGHKVG